MSENKEPLLNNENPPSDEIPIENPLENESQAEENVYEPEEQKPGLPPEIVQKAKKFGHLDRDQYIQKYGTDKGWKDEKAFNSFGDAYSEALPIIKSMKEQMDKKDKQIETMVDYIKQSTETSVRQAKLQLERHLQQAEQLGDVQAVKQLTKQQLEMEEREKYTQAMKEREERARIDEVFLQRNSYWWLQPDGVLRSEAVEISNRLARENPQMSYSNIARQTEVEMKYNHPELNVLPQSRPHIAVSQSNVNKTSNIRSSSERYYSLSADEKVEYQALREVFKNATGKDYDFKDFENYLKNERRGTK